MKWFRTEKTRLARAAGIKLSHLTDIVAGRKGCGRKVALRLELASREVLGEARVIPWTAWVGGEPHPMLESYRKNEVNGHEG
jgi:hypothetical protein